MVAKYDKILTKEMLVREYTGNRKNPYIIAKEYNVSARSVYNFLDKYQIERINFQSRIDPGTKFNKLTTIKIIESNHYGHVWLCKCDCGNEINVQSIRLKNNTTRSCGCLCKKFGPSHPKWNGYKDISGNKWSNIKRSAINRNIKFNITSQYVYQLLEQQNFECSLSGLNISYKNNTASIDRIDNNIGYFEHNIHLVHKDVNRIRWKYSIEEFLLICSLVTNFINNTKEYQFIGPYNICKTFWSDYVYNANRRNIEFNISIDDIYKKIIEQNCRCAITGILLTLPHNNKYYKSRSHNLSIDRIDNKVGYLIHNIRLVDKYINLSKGYINDEYYKYLCRLIHAKQNK